ncbi:MAG: outer membrane beta-barrel protein [Muribaculaceae bacterium]|nr:outer membrane beta-barrel protein [Muribaculaceae bacterium]
MKKYIFMAILAVATVFGAYAESGDIAVGAEFAYASKHSMAGLGLQVQVEPITNWRFAPEFMYYFKNDGLSAYNVNVNFHYVIPTSTTFAIYPLVGFTFASFKADGVPDNITENRCGANIGMGAQYQIKERLHFFTEERFQILKDFNQSVTCLGLKYTF